MARSASWFPNKDLPFATLSPDETYLLALAAAFHRKLTPSDLARVVGGTGLPSGSPTSRNTPLLIQSLRDKGFISAHLTVDAPFAHDVLAWARRMGLMSSIRSSVMTQRPARDSDGILRDARLYLYEGDYEKARSTIEANPKEPFVQLWKELPREWIESTFPPNLQAGALLDLALLDLQTFAPQKSLPQILSLSTAVSDDRMSDLCFLLVCLGKIDEAAQVVGGRTSISADIARAWLSLVRGDVRMAARLGETAAKRYCKEAGKRGLMFPHMLGPFLLAARLANANPDERSNVQAIAERSAKAFPSSCYTYVTILVAKLEDRVAHTSFPGPSNTSIEAVLLDLCVGRWGGMKLPTNHANLLGQFAARAQEGGYTWLAAQIAAFGLSAEAARAELGGTFLGDLVRKPERWGVALDALSQAVDGGASPTGDTRLAWLARQRTNPIQLRVVEQTRVKDGWSVGKPMAAQRLLESKDGLTFLSAADRKACSSIFARTESRYYGRYLDTVYDFDPWRALSALVGADNVYSEDFQDNRTPIQVRAKDPKIHLRQTPEGYHLDLHPNLGHSGAEGVANWCEDGSIEVVRFTPLHQEIQKILGPLGLPLPAHAKARLHEVLSAVSARITVEAEGELEGPGSQMIPGDATIHVSARPFENGLKLRTFVRPLGPGGAECAPGKGGSRVLGVIGGQSRHALRDLELERQKMFELGARIGGSFHGDVATLDTMIGALEALEVLRDAGVEVEWPEGSAWSVTRLSGLDQVHVTVQTNADGFEVAGHVQARAGEDLDLGTFLDYLRASPGRFLQTPGSHAFVALTDEMFEKLKRLSLLTQRGRTVPRLAGVLLEETVAGASVRGDAGWQSFQETVRTLQEVPVPSTFKGELRSYQTEGFRWLTRLDQLGAGGCLADEMGLGKTIQAIAALVQFAPRGASLVVVPTSVAAQWMEQLARFAPTLRVRKLTGGADDVSDLLPHDVVVTTYTMLTSSLDRLRPHHFSVLILDEAHFIKNPETQRAQAAFSIDATLRLAMTGTPVENRLAELWSIFRFLNPGLLGSAKEFATTFAKPIEESRDTMAQSQLKRLLRPFILRRTKTQVADELPPRTEVALRIELSTQEAAIYEAVRKEAIEAVAGRDSKAKLQAKIFAALMKLRRASAHARLVLPEAELESSKLVALAELLDELLPSGHKVLVFSQFTDHLAFIRAELDRKSITYQYLDGATPPVQRQQAVQAFQSGKGDVFLISLKAGGVGLNLTAADYVVHMDPWWNPAAEDQASDRAHRIGQTRPVTIYRLIARDTIEDKILELHHRKRELASAVLEGGDVAGRLTQEELLELIRGV